MSNNIDMYEIGKKLIESAILIDDSLAELLKEQIKLIKKRLKSNEDIDELQKYSNLIKNIIIALILSDEKIKTGIELCMNDKNQ